MKRNIINKRKKIFFAINKSFILLILVFVLIFFYLSFKFQEITALPKKYIENYSHKYGYDLDNIDIKGLKFLDKEKVLSFFQPFKGESIFLIPIQDISNKILQSKWVKSVHINSDYKNSLTVNIKEEIPFGIYDNGNQKLLFSSDLVILEIFDIQNQYSKLITFYGENSIINSKKLILNFDIDFLKLIESAIFIKDRRWDILLRNKILLQLPEKNIINAILNYNKIYNNFSNKDLKQIQSIDLRLSNQAVIKYR